MLTSPNDSAFNFLAALLYTQIFQQIDQNAERSGGSMALPVQVYMDEFAQLGKIPHFLENLAYVRGLNCGITVILQSLSQLKEKYEKNWETFLDCCDWLLFLGSTSKETLEYLSQMLGKQTLSVLNDGTSYSKTKSSSKNWNTYGRELATIDELSKMEKGHGILIVSGMLPFYSKLYALEKDPKYKTIWNPRVEASGKHDKAWQDNHARYYDHLKNIQLDERRALENNFNALLKKYDPNAHVIPG